jgi:leucine dehydrogenase
MDVFSSPAFEDHEQVLFFYDRPSGLKAIVALHDTTLGPAVGGCRFWPYADDVEALTDVLRLAKGMTYKAAMAELPFGGGKTVIIGDPKTARSEELFRALGRAIHSLGGSYYTGEDVGTNPSDMDWAGQETPYVLGRSQGGSGDPSPVTAYGVLLGVKAAIRHRFGRDDLQGVRVAIQGLGNVGGNLASLLAEQGAQLTLADIDADRAGQKANELRARQVGSDEIIGIDAEVFAPCALGGVINDRTLPLLSCDIVAGAANNQLSGPRHGVALHARGILYAPDYVINAGGLINIAQELRAGGYDRGRALAHVATIETTLAEIFERSEREGRPAHEIADRVAEERIEASRRTEAAHCEVGAVAVPATAG